MHLLYDRTHLHPFKRYFSAHSKNHKVSHHISARGKQGAKSAKFSSWWKNTIYRGHMVSIILLLPTMCIQVSLTSSHIGQCSL